MSETEIGPTSAPLGASALGPARLALSTWADTAMPGARYVYHTGHLVVDRLSDPDLDATASYAWELEARGLVALTQLRAVVANVRDKTDAAVYLYLATRTHKDWTGGQTGRPEPTPTRDAAHNPV